MTRLLGIFVLAVALGCGGYWAYKNLRPVPLTARVYTDYSFRLQHSNWPEVVDARFHNAARIFEQSNTAIQWKLLASNEVDPTGNVATLDGRRSVLLQQGGSGDVLIVMTGVKDGERLNSVNPFTRSVIVVDYPDRSETANTLILAQALARLFAAPVDLNWVQSSSSQSVDSIRFPANAVAVIHDLHRYPFASGIDGLLQGSWAKKAVSTLTQHDVPKTGNAEAHAQQVVGISLLNERRRDAAVEHLRQASKLDPNSVALHVETALALSRNGEDQDAIKELQQALKIEPNNAGLHQSLASIYVKLRRTEDAIDEVNAALKIEPRSATSQIVLASALSQQIGHFDAVAKALNEALAIDPNSAAARRDLEQLARNREAISDEIQNLHERLQKVPGDANAHYRLGIAIARTGDLQGGLKELQKSIELSPKYGPAYSETAEIEYELGDYAAAWREVKQARATGTEPPAGFLTGLSKKMPQPQ